MTADITPETVARKLEGVTPTACKYRWKIDGEYVQWRYSDASNYHRSLDGFEEVALYSAEHFQALAARLAADTKAHEKEIAVWSENYAALERRLAEVVRQRDDLAEQARQAHPTMQRMRLAENKANARAEAAEKRLAEVEEERDRLEDINRGLVRDFNALNAEGARQDDRLKDAEAENAKLREDLARSKRLRDQYREALDAEREHSNPARAALQEKKP